ncbi:hypothetical protein Ancab_028414 [Ancistrocladus abbreviatus]
MESSDHMQYIFKIENYAEIIRSSRSRKQPPVHYKLDIDSFSLLPSLLLAASPFVESTEFCVGGHRWKLNVLPRGYGVEKGKCLSVLELNPTL